MARPVRLSFPGVALHVIQRGHNRNACFREESDYLVYLAHLRQLSAKHGCALHAYCLMTNHVHLLLTPGAAGACTALMRDLGRRYVQYFNRRYRRSGTLWEGRFRSCIAESAHYVLGCYRYIELNPVRAAMVEPQVRHAAYRRMFDQGLEPDLQRSIRKAINGGYPLASDTFKASVIAPVGGRTQPGKRGPRAKSPEGLAPQNGELPL